MAQIEVQGGAAGLEGVVAVDTVLSDVDRLAGRVVIRGQHVADLAGQARFEETLKLMLDGFFEHLPDIEELGRRLGAARVQAYQALPIFDGQFLAFDAVRALTARLPDGEDLQTALLLLLEALTLPPDAFTCVFAMARTAGWIAHAREQALQGRLIRPQSRYVGPAPLAA